MTIELQNWTYGTENPYDPPEFAVFSGEVYGHPRFADGFRVRPSKFVAIDYETHTLKSYSGSLYTLGEPDVGYDSKFPNARSKMIEQLLSLLPHEQLG